MRKIVLCGSLAEQFGSEFELDVRSPREAAQALAHLVPGFREAVLSHPVGFHVKAGEEYRSQDDVHIPCARQETIVITPAISGSGSTARIIVGAVLIVVGAVLDVYGYGAGQPIMALGISMLVGGVAEKLAGKPKTAETQNGTNMSGYAFSSGINTTGQGVGLALSYGRGLSGTHVASAQIVAEAGVFLASFEGPVVPVDGPQNEGGPADVGTGGSAGDGDQPGSWTDDVDSHTFDDNFGGLGGTTSDDSESDE